MVRPGLATAALVAGAAALAGLLFPRLGSPLFWQDEAETAMYAERILEFGYPKVHGERNVVYEFGENVAQGLDERLDAFIGTTWGDFYFAVPGAWWARGTGDPRARTARMRLPFAVVGFAGIGLFAAALAPAWRDPRHARLFAAALFAGAALSISLVLHLREVRYYALLVALTGAILGVHLRHAVFAALGTRAWAVALTLLLVLLFHVHFTAFFAVAVPLAAERAWTLRRAGPAALAAAAAPFAASALLLLPSFAFFETFRIARGFSTSLGLTPARYAANLAEVGVHFLRYELLAPGLVARLGRGVTERRLARQGVGPPEGGRPRRAADLLWWFAAGYALVGCANPLVYERYFVPLSPVVTAAFLLDAAGWYAAAGRLRRPAPRTARIVLFVLLAGAFAASPARIAAVAGRLEEIARPPRGPIDFAVEFIRDRYEDPEQLVIATNYEAQPLMYYLGSRVIVGLSLNNIAAERGLEPDVVIPRRHWPRALPEVLGFLRRGRYERHALPVADLHTNHVPALSASPRIPDPHRFRTARPEQPGAGLLVFTRDPRNGDSPDARPEPDVRRRPGGATGPGG